MRLRWYVIAASAVVVVGCGDGTGLVGGVFVEKIDTVFVTRRGDLSEGGTKPTEAPGNPVVMGSFVLTPSVVVQDTSLMSPPMSLLFVVTATNSSDTSAVLGVSGCTVWPQVYASPTRASAPVVPEGTCAQAPYADTVASGGDASFSFLAYNGLLSEGLGDGRYYANVAFRMPQDSIVLAVGSIDVRFQVPGLSFHVAVRQRDSGVEASVVVTNLNASSAYLEWGACDLSLSLYEDADRQELAAPWYVAGSCPDYLAVTSLAPGDSLAAPEFTDTFAPSHLPGDGSVKPGRYYLNVNLFLNDHTYSLPIGVVQVW